MHTAGPQHLQIQNSVLKIIFLISCWLNLQIQNPCYIENQSMCKRTCAVQIRVIQGSTVPAINNWRLKFFKIKLFTIATTAV